jgi:hypothetical protein
MNTVNASMGFSGFQLHLGRSPQVIPPIVPDRLPLVISASVEGQAALAVIEKLKLDSDEAKDNLLVAKVFQSHYTNRARGPEVIFKLGERVMLSMLNHRREYKAKGERHVAKFFPHFDGPYTITDVHPETSNYTLEMPNSNVFPTFHASELKRFILNDTALFPQCELMSPGPIVTADGLEEYFIEEIVDACRRGHGWQFLVRWQGYGPESNEWLSASELEDSEALDVWYGGGGKGPARS